MWKGTARQQASHTPILIPRCVSSVQQSDRRKATCVILRGALQQGAFLISMAGFQQRQALLIQVNSAVKEPEEEQNITRDQRADGVFTDSLRLKKKQKKKHSLDESHSAQKSICRKTE